MHRDLKPENVMVDDDDRVKLIDFGIAGQSGSRRLTFAKLSQVMGTPDYISPEQVKGKRGDGRSDIYAAGRDALRDADGQDAVSRDQRLRHHERPAAQLPRAAARARPEISPELQEVIYRALERDPKSRYATAKEFAWDLAHLDQVGVADRPELRDWRLRRKPWLRRALFYAMLALIPVVVFGLLLYVARHS